MTPQQTETKRKLWPLSGGLHIDDNKVQSTRRPLRESAVPKRLVIPLQQHVGEVCTPLVKVGDRVTKGQKIADSGSWISATVHASTSGRVVEVGNYPAPHASALPRPCVVIDADGRDEWCALPEPVADHEALDSETITSRLREAGLVGLGGGAFPTFVKLNPGPQRSIRTLIINGAECEPYITCDDLLMRLQAREVITGAMIMLRLLGAEECLVGIEDNKPEAIEAMEAMARELGRGKIEVVTIPTRYPSGGEKQLIRILTGREVPSGSLPADIGIVCHNVGTAAAVTDAVLEGKPLIERYVTFTGEGVAEPQNIRVRIGTLISDLIPEVGGYTGKGSRLILGGPMMGITLPSDEFPVTKAVNCIFVPSAEESPAPEPAKPCIRCGRCAGVCPMNLLPQQMYWHIRVKHSERAREYNLEDCIECGCCSHVCPSQIPLVQYYRFGKADLRARDEEARRAQVARERSEAREARLERLEQEKQAKLAAKKAAMKKKSTPASEDPNKAAIEAASQRAAEKKARLAEQGVTPENTADLEAFQQRQIDKADQRRSAADSEADRGA